ncbi:MAG: hypothetical protein K2R98_14280 [Gemmataceae bacterium]|nr:hypothetical protein [Gemmataceae bacterium]
MERTRREFLADVGRGMLIATVGPAVASDLGLARVVADEEGKRLTFGNLEPLVSLMQETPAVKLLPALVEKIRTGTELRTLTAAGALANARQLGGQDYTGFHTFMALSPAFEMSREMPEDRRALPVLKVLYRNAEIIQTHGGGVGREHLKPVKPIALPENRAGSEVLREAVFARDMNKAEGVFAAIAAQKPEDAYNDLLHIVQDEMNVHRVVLAWRAWQTLDLTGKEHAHTLLRQSVRYSINGDDGGTGRGPIQKLLPKLLDQYKLVGKPIGTRQAEDAWIEKLAIAIYGSNGEQAADAAAAALAEGFAPESVGEAISLAANRVVLFDRGRGAKSGGYKGNGSVHGDSVGVHASDAANAWRSIARVSNARNTFASLIVGAYHTAGQAGNQLKYPYPPAAELEKIQTKEADKLLQEAEAAIKDREQARVCALIHRYGDLGHPARAVFDLLIKYAVSEDGALHGEKYYRTVSEEFSTMRPAFRWRELVALARVTASEYGKPAAGYADACKLLKL